jgi:hypothetical protein
MNRAQDIHNGYRYARRWVLQRKCIVISALALVFLGALFWGLYPPPAVKFTDETVTTAKVLKWVVKSAKCSKGGYTIDGILHNTSIPGEYSFRCSTAAKKFDDRAFFTAIIVLVIFALLIRNYPPELVCVVTPSVCVLSALPLRTAIFMALLCCVWVQRSAASPARRC